MAQDYPSHVKRWDVFEVVLSGTAEGNPFTEQTLTGIFTSREESVTVRGFYDGDGIYRIRFMPSYEGRYTFILRSSFFEGTLSGAFYSDPADGDVHGPVRVKNRYHFAYADGMPYYPLGTTSYTWELQDDNTVKQTLNALKDTSFSKLRFCIFPWQDRFNLKDPSMFPYEGTSMDASAVTEDNFRDYIGKCDGNHFDCQRFNPAYFRRIEKNVKQLRNAGIEADLILFHPYDRWGFSAMSEEENELYLNYMINRFAAYRNVWWSLGEQWDLIGNRSVDEWEHYAEILKEKDPYHHLRSILNGVDMYDQTKTWITHVSIRSTDRYKTAEETDQLREKYQKPILMEETGYEGNMPCGDADLTGEEVVRRFWEASVRGGYPGHSEGFVRDPEQIWYLHGGDLKGESWKRTGFLLKILSEVPGNGIACSDYERDSVCGVPEEESSQAVKSQYIFYYSFTRPSWRYFHMDDDTDYVAEIIDTWNMTIQVAGIYHGSFRIDLPGKPYMAVRLRRASAEDYKSLNSGTDVSDEKDNPPVSEPEEKPAEEIADPDDVIDSMNEEVEEDKPENDYMEATVVSKKAETAPAQEADDTVLNEEQTSPFPADAEVQHEEFMREETVEETDEPLDLSSDEDTGELDLPASSDDEDELPDIVTGKFTKVNEDHDALEDTAELRNMPIEGGNEDHTPHSGTLNILTSFRRRRKNS